MITSVTPQTCESEPRIRFSDVGLENETRMCFSPGNQRSSVTNDMLVSASDKRLSRISRISSWMKDGSLPSSAAMPKITVATKLSTARIDTYFSAPSSDARAVALSMKTVEPVTQDGDQSWCSEGIFVSQLSMGLWRSRR